MRIGLWLTEFWNWILPALAALDPMVAAYSAGYFQESVPSVFTESTERPNIGNVGVVIPGPFQAAEVG